MYGQPVPPYRPGVPAYLAEGGTGPVGGYGYPGARVTTVSGLAVAALVCSLLPLLFPVAIGLGIGALVAIRRGGLRGSGMAIVALILGGLQTALFGLIVIAGASTGFEDPEAGPTVDAPSAVPEPTATGVPTYVDDLVTGNCYNTNDDENADEDVYVLACAVPHEAEVTGEATLTLTQKKYPGDRPVDRAAGSACDRVFAAYVGASAEKTALSPGFWTPDRKSWEHGDRLAVCVTGGQDDDPLTGSVKGTKR